MKAKPLKDILIADFVLEIAVKRPSFLTEVTNELVLEHENEIGWIVNLNSATSVYFKLYSNY